MYDKLEFINNSISKILFMFLKLAPNILNVVKYTFLDFKIILTIKYDIKNNTTITTIVTTTFIIFIICFKDLFLFVVCARRVCYMHGSLKGHRESPGAGVTGGCV